MVRQCVKEDRFQHDIVKEEKFTCQNESPSNTITNAKYFISPQKKYHFVLIYNQKNSFHSYRSRTFMVITNTYIYIYTPPNRFMHFWTNLRDIKYPMLLFSMRCTNTILST